MTFQRWIPLVLGLFFLGNGLALVGQNPNPTVFKTDSSQAEWWKDAVFYEIFVRSFYDSDGDGIGDFQGLIQKLDYLNDGDPNTTDDLGIEGIWLMPISPSPSYHGYDVTDYRGVNPDFGTMQDFRDFLDAAHARGIRVIVDYVMNHSSTEHPWHQDARNNANNRRNFYRWTSSAPNYQGPWGQSVWHFHNSGYYYGLFWGGMPDLNYDEPAVRDSMFTTAEYWLNDIGVDGFRLDAIKYIYEWQSDLEDLPGTFNFWKLFEHYTDSVSPGSFHVGEAWTNTDKVVKYVENGGLDICFEFNLASDVMWAANSGQVGNLETKIEEVMQTYPDQRFGTFLTNHDMDRVYNVLGQDEDKNKVAASLLLTLPGVPFLYYGEEVGMSGTKPDVNIRRPMQWDGSPNAGFTTGSPWHGLNGNFGFYNVDRMQQEPTSLWSHYHRFIQLRNAEPSLRRGDYLTASGASSALMGFWRYTATDTLLVLVNCSDDALQNARFDVSGMGITPGNYFWQDLVVGAGENLIVDPQGDAVIDEMPAYGSKVFALHAQAIVERPEPETETQAFKIFPNPGGEQLSLYVEGKPGETYAVRLYNVGGQIVFSGNGLRCGRRISLQVQDLSPGSYQVEIDRGGAVAAKTWIKAQP